MVPLLTEYGKTKTRKIERTDMALSPPTPEEQAKAAEAARKEGPGVIEPPMPPTPSKPETGTHNPPPGGQPPPEKK